MKRGMFATWEPEIHKYCEDNGLDFNKAKTMPKAWNKDFLVFLYADPNERTRGLLDETPAPIVLRMDLVNGNPVFTQTEYTKKYLG